MEEGGASEDPNSLPAYTPTEPQGGGHVAGGHVHHVSLQ